MKIRNGFVSNSSSSSFIVIGKKPTECENVELNKKQIEIIVDYIKTRKWWSNEVAWDGEESVFLTQFVSDCSETHFDIPKKYNAYHYQEGNHGEPYDEESYDILQENDDGWSNVWILKEHNLEKE